MPKKPKKPTELKDSQDEKLFTIFEAANYLGVSEATLKLWIAHGRITQLDVIGSACIPFSSIKNFSLTSGRFTARGPVRG
jgi:excisionase family DNA binding protein